MGVVLAVCMYLIFLDEYPAVRSIRVSARYLLVDFAFSSKKPKIIQFQFCNLKSIALVPKEEKTFPISTPSRNETQFFAIINIRTCPCKRVKYL